MMRDLFELLFITSLLMMCYAKAPADPLWVDQYRQAINGEVYGKPHTCVWFADRAEDIWRKAGAPGRGYQVTLACSSTRKPEPSKRHRIFVVDQGSQRWCISNADAYEISPTEDLSEAWNYYGLRADGFGSCWDVETMARCANINQVATELYQEVTAADDRRPQ